MSHSYPGSSSCHKSGKSACYHTLKVRHARPCTTRGRSLGASTQDSALPHHILALNSSWPTALMPLIAFSEVEDAIVWNNKKPTAPSSAASNSSQRALVREQHTMESIRVLRRQLESNWQWETALQFLAAAAAVHTRGKLGFDEASELTDNVDAVVQTLVRSHMQSMAPADVPQLLRHLALLQWYDQALLDRVDDIILSSLNALKPHHLEQLMSSWTSLQHEPPAELMTSIWAASERGLQRLSPGQLTRLASSLPSMTPEPPLPWLRSYQQLLVSTCCACDPPHLFHILPSLAAATSAISRQQPHQHNDPQQQQQHQQPSFARASLSPAPAPAPASARMSASTATSAAAPTSAATGQPQLSALSGTSHDQAALLTPYHQKLLQQHFHKLQQNLPAASPGQLAALPPAMQRLQLQPPAALLQQLHHALLQQLSLLKASELVPAFDALMALGVEPSTRDVEAVLQRLHALLPRMAGDEVGKPSCGAKCLSMPAAHAGGACW
jgi:hypothetical protein